MINTHGLKMVGLRNAAGETHDINSGRGHYVQVSYDRATGSVITNHHVDIGRGSMTQYENPSIITICNASCKMTMQQIADTIAERVAQ